MKTVAISALIVLAAMSGCIQNMADFKDRLGANEEPVAPAAVAETPPVETPAPNVTPTKPPVARISVFGTNGALLFKSTFQADNVTDVLFVEEKSKVNLIGSDSEALENGAKIASYAWTMNGKPAGDQKQATIEVGEAGLYPVVLTVTDSLGKADTQSLQLGVAPKPFDVVTELSVAAIPGAQGAPAGTSVDFELKVADAKVPAMIQAVSFAASPAATCDVAMDVLDAAGESIGAANDAGLTSGDQTETVMAGALAEGTYTITLTPRTCASNDAIPVTVTVTYLPMIEGLDAGDGHGAHAGH